MLYAVQLILIACLAAIGFIRVRQFYVHPLSGLASLDSSHQQSSIHRSLPVSVIIPARNEAGRLGKLLESLQQQCTKPHEILVVDDGSTDGTAELALRYGCRVIEQQEAGWSGKSAACYSGAQAASGEYLLFLDADVYLAPDALEYLYRYSRRGAVMSVQPYHHMGKAYEQLSLYFNLVALLGLDLGRRRDPFSTKLGFFGPCMLMERESYLKTGGHRLVRDSILEDMALGQAFARLQIPLYSIPHGNKIFFRMYAEGFMKLFNGWSKNMVLGAQRSSLYTILIISSIAALSFKIPAELIRSMARMDLPLGMLNVFFYICFAWILHRTARRFGAFSLASCLCFPLLALFFVVVLLRSMVMQFLHMPIDWRGRKVFIK
jgi:4,4'-diaponeurosporenoate glycosyltransferase